MSMFSCDCCYRCDCCGVEATTDFDDAWSEELNIFYNYEASKTGNYGVRMRKLLSRDESLKGNFGEIVYLYEFEDKGRWLNFHVCNYCLLNRTRKFTNIYGK